MGVVKVLSPDDVAVVRRGLDEDGFAVLRGVVSSERIDEFNSALLREYERTEKFKGGGSYSGHLNCFPGQRSRFFYEELEEAGVVDLIHELRPNVSNALRATLNFNLPNSVEQHYHMDGLYTEEFIICNIGVVDTDLVNGAIDMLPGTHRQFYKFWQYAVKRLYRRSTRIPMKRGDVLIRKSTVWHRGMPNRSTEPRPMMSLTFGEKSAPDGDAFTVHEGKMFFYPNWFNTSRLGILRERVFVAAPLSYSAYRFVTSLRGNKGYSSF